MQFHLTNHEQMNFEKKEIKIIPQVIAKDIINVVIGIFLKIENRHSLKFLYLKVTRILSLIYYYI